MKIYKRSLFKSITWRVYIIPWLFHFFIWAWIFDGLAFWRWGKAGFIVFLFVISLYLPVLFTTVFLMVFYIELYDNKIILVNGILKFWRKEYLFSQYPVCGIEYNRGHITNIIKMRKQNTKGLLPYVGIDLVDPRDLKEIVSFMEQRGVVVHVKDIKELES